jgi:hypothetical protein
LLKCCEHCQSLQKWEATNCNILGLLEAVAEAVATLVDTTPRLRVKLIKPINSAIFIAIRACVHVYLSILCVGTKVFFGPFPHRCVRTTVFSHQLPAIRYELFHDFCTTVFPRLRQHRCIRDCLLLALPSIGIVARCWPSRLRAACGRCLLRSSCFVVGVCSVPFCNGLVRPAFLYLLCF